MKISIDKIYGNPDNPNVMTEEIKIKLKRNIARQEGKYPALIVRATTEGHRIIDGHNRFEILKELGYKEVDCDIWDVDDKTEKILLATLNELKGRPDLEKRSALLGELVKLGLERNQIEKLLPEDRRRLDFFLDFAHAKETVEGKRNLLREQFIQDGMDSKKAEALADIGFVKEYHSTEKIDEPRKYLVFFFKDKALYEKANEFFGGRDRRGDTNKLLELI